ncbi:hypothetical protein CCACVL1_18105 [Corchorus capsularis]|uniref:Uncharacterized protein n=1 Tax=Corchorus capsularis TaxID=210143 RepID=A0A1R3HMV3_COCAP|nr:hypothetical protein CCACVL1_18105 [Corchorus capsularis]
MAPYLKQLPPLLFEKANALQRFHSG